jgi:hypothetical protein
VAAGRERGSRPRRVSLPGVAELLRPVGPGLVSDLGRQASGRESHSQKITVYLSSDEFLELERGRLALRAHGIAVDRGRLVREAIALLMTDLEAGIDASVTARRLHAAGQPDPADMGLAAVCPASGGPFTNGVPADGAPADGARVNGGPASGVLAGGGPPPGAPAGGGAVNSAAAAGGPVVVVLANGVGATGPPEGPQ